LRGGVVGSGGAGDGILVGGFLRLEKKNLIFEIDRRNLHKSQKTPFRPHFVNANI
jgi:hypothetical protein